MTNTLGRLAILIIISISFFYPSNISAQNFEWAKWFETDSDEDNFNAVCTDDSGHVFVAIQFNNLINIAGESFQNNAR